MAAQGGARAGRAGPGGAGPARGGEGGAVGWSGLGCAAERVQRRGAAAGVGASEGRDPAGREGGGVGKETDPDPLPVRRRR